MSNAATIPLFSAALGKTQAQIRDDILRTLSNHLKGLGIANPNVGQTSDYWGIATGVANEICVGVANGIVNTDNQMPDTAGGSFLDRWLALFGLSRAGATQSSGVVTPAFSLAQGYTNVPTGAQLIDSVGLRYVVTAPGQYGPGNPSAGQPPKLQVPVLSVDSGSAVDHANGDQLTWVTFVAFVESNVVVGIPGGTDGLSGGNNSEVGQDEPPRSRLLARMQNPPAGGNWPDVVRWCTESSPDVQAGFCYPALLGPATVFFCGVGAAQTQAPLTKNSKSRQLPAALVTGTLLPYVQGKYSTRAAVVGAGCVDQPTDVALVLALPAAPTAQPSGPGGGWLDGSPWPSSSGGNAVVVKGFVQSPAVLSGSSVAGVTVAGTPAFSPTNVQIVIDATGALGVGTATWTLNGVAQPGFTLASTVTLGATGLVANFPAGTYNSGDSIVSTTSQTSFVVGAQTPPTAGVSRIAYVSVSDWTLYVATVLAFSGSPGTYTITIDQPWPNLGADCAVISPGGLLFGPGSAIFPQSVNQENYLAAVFQGFGLLGPGEWSSNAAVLVRAFRHPVPSQQWPSSLDANFLRGVEDAGDEVLSVQYLYRSATAPAVPTTPTITTTEPLTLTSPPPNILVPRSISFYAQ